MPIQRKMYVKKYRNKWSSLGTTETVATTTSFIIKFISACYRYRHRFVLYCFAILQLILYERWDEICEHVSILVCCVCGASTVVFRSYSCLGNCALSIRSDTTCYKGPQNWAKLLSLSLSFNFSDLLLWRAHTNTHAYTPYFVCLCVHQH